MKKPALIEWIALSAFSVATAFAQSQPLLPYGPLRDAQDVNEYAFAVGSMSHYAADNDGHRLAVNRAMVETSRFGNLDDGTAVEMLTLTNAKGATAKVITYGATCARLPIGTG